ncbi:MAG: SPOR domain-containing protein [Prevotellaceae bacterium]|nr:SPOR domain-containing protein [Prevotellaceae bacterium]
MKRVIVVLAVIAQTMTLSAQSFLWHLKKDEPGKGSIVIKQDKALDYLIDNREPEIVVDTLPGIKEIQVEAPKTRRLRYDTLRTRPTMPDFPLKKRMLARSDSTYMMGGTKKIMSNVKKVTGYRIQLFAGGNTREDRQKAEAIGRRAKSLFPSQPIYTHFYSPRWVCRMGNFEDFEDAQAALRRARNAGIKDASIIKGTITVKK